MTFILSLLLVCSFMMFCIYKTINDDDKWALSNVLENNGSKNDILFDWSQKYIIHHLNYTYNNCNYHRKNKGSNDSDEVLITNY
jgi:hypothetical protein